MQKVPVLAAAFTMTCSGPPTHQPTSQPPSHPATHTPSPPRPQVARINANRPAEEVYQEVRRLFMEF